MAEWPSGSGMRPALLEGVGNGWGLEPLGVHSHSHSATFLLPWTHRVDGRPRVISPGNSLAVQWLGRCTFTAEGPGSIPGRGTKIPQALWRGQKKKDKKE